MNFEQPSMMPETPEKKEGEKTLEAVLESLENKKKEIVAEIRPKLHPDYRGVLYDSTIESLYGPLKRLQEYGLMSEREINKHAGLNREGMYKEHHIVDSAAQSTYFLKEHEDALLLGAYENRDELDDNLKNIKEERILSYKKIGEETKEERERWRELRKITAETDENLMKKIKGKFFEYFPTQPKEGEMQLTWLRKNRSYEVAPKEHLFDAKTLQGVGFSRVYFGRFLDMIDLEEAGVIDLKKMSESQSGGSQMVGLYEGCKAEAPIDKFKIASQMEKLREAYLYGIISSRQEYLDLVKQSFEKNKWEKGV